MPDPDPLRLRCADAARRGLPLLAVLLAGACVAADGDAPLRRSLRPLPASPAGYATFSGDQTAEIESSADAEAVAGLAEQTDLRALLEVVLHRNPRIRRARDLWEAAVEQVPQSSALPDPTLQVVHFLDSVETRVGPQDNVFTLMQRIPYPGKLSLAADAATEAARKAGFAYQATVRDVLVDAKIAYFEYVYLTRALDLVDQNVGIAHRLAGLGADLYSQDKALLIDVLKAQSQLAQLDYDRITLVELIAAEETRLNTLMDRAPQEPLGLPTGIGFPRLQLAPERIFELAAEFRPEFRMADRAIEEARFREELARAQYVPDVSVGATFVQVDKNSAPLMVPPDNGQDAFGLSLGLTLPIWNNRIAAGVRQARARRRAAERGKAVEWNATFAALKDAYFRLTNAERLVLLYRDSLVPQAKQVMLSTEERSREDRMRLGDYLEAQTVWLNFTLALERSKVDYNQAIARLERLTGANLVRAAAAGEDE